ncbi:MAG: hypothetical protein P8008_01540 [Gammaproteobacteria bacterium]
MNASTLPYLSVIEFRGRDAADFLHRQLSADIAGLPAGGSTFACLCQPKGRVIALLLAWRVDDAVRVICSADLAESVAAWLGRFVFRDDVQIALCDDWSVLGSLAVIPGGSAEPIAGLHYAIAERDENDGDTASTAAFRAAELERGVAWLDARTSETFLPQMLGAEAAGALSYRKGCYPGQEIVARTHFLGRLKQRPVVIRAAAGAGLEPGGRVTAQGGPGGEAEASVVDRALDAGGRCVALLVVRSTEPFEIESLRSESGVVPVEATWLPVGQGSATT